MNRSIRFFLAVTLAVVAALLYVRGRLFLVELSFSLSEKRTAHTKLEADRQALLVELATLKSPRRIEKIARERLGLKRSLSTVAVVNVTEEPSP